MTTRVSEVWGSIRARASTRASDGKHPRHRWIAIAGVAARAVGGSLLVALPAVGVRVARLVPLATRRV